MEKANALQSFKKWLSSSLFVKLATIFIIILILMIPNSFVKNLISERQHLNRSVEDEIGSKWGGSQDIAGPVLCIPYWKYTKFIVDSKEKVNKTKDWMFILPRDYNIEGNVDPEIRKRGIYRTTVYSSQLNFQGDFQLNLKSLNIPVEAFLFSESIIAFNIPDLKGIEKDVVVNWQDKSLRMNPGVPFSDDDLFSSGLHVPVPILADQSQYTFDFDLSLKGSKTLMFAPIGQKTKVQLSSSWPSPSFDGGFLPDSHNITNEGFTAIWEVYDMNRNIPQQNISTMRIPYGYNFGLHLIQPVDEYLKNYRSARYALLLISLTFLIYLFFEILKKQRIHPLQYILVGLSLTVFFVLLLSLSEYIGFDKSYLVAASVTILLISVYSQAVFKSLKLASLLLIFLTIIFGFIYVILQLEEYSLLVGSIGLFAILAIIMLSTRKLDWYKLYLNE